MPKETNKEKALSALLNTASVIEASQTCGLSEKTLRRFLEDADFQKEYRTARRSLVETSISQIQKATGEAVKALQRNLHCENPAVEVRCAQIIIEAAVKGVELIDVIERLEALEDAVKTETQEN